MKRVILSAPVALDWDDLTEEQQTAIAGVFGQYVMPMPGTIEYAGQKIIDAVTLDSFDPANIPILGLPFEILGLWQWDGVTLTVLENLHEAFYDYVESGIRAIPHSWAGWPS